jgi:uncharacterized protein (DUF2126 family)
VTPAILDAARAQDAALAAAGLAIWIGAEPTFTDRSSQEPWWLGQAEGGDKAARAEALLRALAPRMGEVTGVGPVPGRQYPGESAPRFAFGAALRAAHGEARFTVTPDPGVVEVNLPPAPDLATFAAWSEAVHAAAAEVGLSPLRWRYNGHETDSGGGGQVTLGGPSPRESPFLLRPRLLPRLVRYLSNHPALSYAFAPDCVGSASQGPRPDEGSPERFRELAVALDLLDHAGDGATPELLWEALGPLLVDGSGNSHRAELNVEKLWNPYLPERGKLGLAEFRALRMQPTPARATAVAALLRGVATRLALFPYGAPLAGFGELLHDRAALPHALEADLRAVLADLDGHGLGLAPPLARELTAPREPVATLALGDATLAVLPAAEFWPLLGDVASQERSGARLVDASSARIELRVDHPPGADPGRAGAAGLEVPLHPAGPGRHVAAVRWRQFTPRPGLHPGLPPTDPLVLAWERGGARRQLALHGWIPGGGVYDGLPRDAAEAARRRAERVVVTAPPFPLSLRRPLRAGGVTLDLRRLPGATDPESARAGGAA